MTDFKFLGLDETRNGRSDVLFVGVASSRPEDIKKTENLQKIRKNNKDFKKKSEKTPSPEKYLSKIFSVLEENPEKPTSRDFRYVLIPEYFSSHFHKQQIKIIGFSEIIKSFGGLEKVIIDGQMREKSKGILKELTYLPTTVSCPKADIQYPVVNMADQIADILYGLYSCSKKNGIILNNEQDSILTSRMLEPKLSDYKNRIRR